MLLTLFLATNAAATPPPTAPPFRHWRQGHGLEQMCAGGQVRDIDDYGAKRAGDPAVNISANQAAINDALADMAPCDALLINGTSRSGVASLGVAAPPRPRRESFARRRGAGTI